MLAGLIDWQALEIKLNIGEIIMIDTKTSYQECTNIGDHPET